MATTDYGAVDVNENGSTRFNRAKVIVIPFGKKKVFVRSLTIQKVLGTAAALLSLIVVIVVFTNVSRGSVSTAVQVDSSRVLQAGSDTTTTTSRPRQQPTVQLTQGTLQGTILQSRGGRDYNAFYTVPYGKPPVGNLRFQACYSFLTAFVVCVDKRLPVFLSTASRTSGRLDRNSRRNSKGPDVHPAGKVQPSQDHRR